MVRLAGQYLALFMAALLFLWLTEGQKRKDLTRYCFLMLFFLLTPAGLLLIRYQTSFYGHENIWRLLPLTVVTAWGLAAAEGKVSEALTRPKGRQRFGVNGGRGLGEALGLVILSALLWLCGSLSLGSVITEEKSRMDGLPKEAAVLADLEIPEDDFVYLLAPDEVSEWARIYSGRLLLPYGRNLYEPELSAFLYDTYDWEMESFHDWINGIGERPEDEEQAVSWEADFLETCAHAGYHYLIFARERVDGALKQALACQDRYREEIVTDQPYRIYTLR